MEYSLLNHAFYDLKVNKVFCRTLSSNEKVCVLPWWRRLHWWYDCENIEIGI